MAPREADPLGFFMSDLEERRRGSRAFESGEHVWLGNEGVARACAARNVSASTFLRIRRLKSKEKLSYGEVVALSGDFYPSPEALFEERPSPMPWLREENDLEDLRAAFRVELAWIEDEGRGAGVRYPDQNVVYAWNAKSYVELALDNNVHFGWHNLVAYCRHHGAAIALALSARNERDNAKSDELLRRALYTNAFADHFLTDAFAAGHIRMPRAQTRKWAKSTNMDEKLAGALSKLVHDQDGHVSTLHAQTETRAAPEDGLQVINTRGDIWFTRCDGQLFIADKKDTAIEQPVAAVAESFGELLRAFLDGDPVAGPYEALRRAPFPHPEGIGLCDKFSASLSAEKVDALVESVAWYMKVPWIGTGLNRDAVMSYFAALPSIVEEFRADVRAEHDATPDLAARMPRDYVEAFQSMK